jgi:hypothetical protein
MLKSRHREIEFEIFSVKKLYNLNPKPEDLIVSRLNLNFVDLEEGRTRVCCIKLGWLAIGSEKLTDFGDSWFSAKAIKVACFLKINLGKVLIDLGGVF